MIAPLLTTPRLRLRAFALADFEPSFAMSSDERVFRYVGGAPQSRAQSWEKFLRGPGFWALLGYGLWTIEERETGAYVGQIGFGRFERDIAPRLPDIPEGAWMLGGDHHGKGYAREALGAALGWADETLQSPICCIIDPANAASIRLAEAAGFREVRRADYLGGKTVVLERPAPGR